MTLASDDEADDDGRPRVDRRLPARQHEDADTDDRADADRGELPDIQYVTELARVPASDCNCSINLWRVNCCSRPVAIPRGT